MDSLKTLCLCVAPDQNAETILSQMKKSQINWESVIYCSGQHLVTPALGFYLKEKGVFSLLEKELQDYLDQVYDLNLTRNQRIQNQLLALLPDFNKAGIQPLLLKGIASLFGELYEDLGIRVLSDIDLLIPQDKLLRASEIMQAHGYQPPPENATALGSHHLPPFLHDDQPASIEIHRFPGPLKFSRWVNNDNAWEKSLELSLDSGVVRLPTPEFRLLHNFCHCQLTDRGYVYGYVNVRQMVEWVKLRHRYDKEIDWRSLQKIADKNSRATGAWAGYLLAVERYFLQPVPDSMSIPFGARLFIRRLQWGMKYGSAHKILRKSTYLFLGLIDLLMLRTIRFKYGSISSFKALGILMTKLFSPAWYQRQWENLKNK